MKLVRKAIVVIFFILLQIIATYGGTSLAVTGFVRGAGLRTTSGQSVTASTYISIRINETESYVMVDQSGSPRFRYEMSSNQNVGNLATQWQVGETLVAFYEYEQNAGQSNHIGYYGVDNAEITQAMSDASQLQFSYTTVNAIPTPSITVEDNNFRVNWDVPTETIGEPQTTNIVGYYLYRGTDPANLTDLVTQNRITTTNYLDTSVVTGNTYYYALKLAFLGGISGNIYSANSDSIFIVDLTSPEGSVIINNGDAYTNSNTVNLTITDNATSAVSMNVWGDNVNETGWLDISTNYQITMNGVEGVNTVSVTLRKTSGAQATFNDTIIYDSVLPTASVEVPNTSVSANINTITVNFSEAVNQAVIIEIVSDQGSITSNSGTWIDNQTLVTTNVSMPADYDGMGTINVYGITDLAGNTMVLTQNLLTINIDTLQPTVTAVVLSKAGQTVSNSIIVTFNLSEAMDIAFTPTVEFLYNSGQDIKTETSGAWASSNAFMSFTKLFI